MRHSWKDLPLYPWVELAMLHHAHDVALSYCKLRDSRWAVPIQVDTSTIVFRYLQMPALQQATSYNLGMSKPKGLPYGYSLHTESRQSPQIKNHLRFTLLYRDRTSSAPHPSPMPGDLHLIKPPEWRKMEHPSSPYSTPSYSVFRKSNLLLSLMSETLEQASNIGPPSCDIPFRCTCLHGSPLHRIHIACSLFCEKDGVRPSLFLYFVLACLLYERYSYTCILYLYTHFELRTYK